jgi:hypothetical protein
VAGDHHKGPHVIQGDVVMLDGSYPPF